MRTILFLLSLSITSYCAAQVDISRIDSILKKAVGPNNSPGLIAGLVKDGHLIYQQGFGNMNLEYAIPFNDSTIIGLASVTKQFTAACIGILAKEKKLSINDDVRKYIPELAYYEDTIRIQHLLNHTSGIRNHNVLLDLMGFDYEHQGYTNASIEQLMFRQKGVNNRPGEKMLYSNTNYVLLALIVKRVSGQAIHEFAQEHLFGPLEMKHTFYISDRNALIKNRAYGYYQTKEGYKQPSSNSLCVGAGGMKSSIADLAKWSQVFLDQHHPYHYLGEFITTLDTLSDGSAMKHARGMFVSPYKNHISYNHSGRDRGMRSQFICIPDYDLALIIYANCNTINAVDLSYQIIDLFVDEELEAEKLTNFYQHSNAELEQYVGVYQELNSDMKMKVFIEKDTLKVQNSLGRQIVPLQSVSKSSFQRFDNPAVKHVFLIEQNKTIAMQVDFGGAIFYFEPIILNPQANQNLADFVGTYYSEELDVSYQLSIEESQLVLNYPNNYGIKLNEGELDVFGSNRRTRYTFARDKSNKVKSFTVAAEGTVSQIYFEKIK